MKKMIAAIVTFSSFAISLTTQAGDSPKLPKDLLKDIEVKIETIKTIETPELKVDFAKIELEVRRNLNNINELNAIKGELDDIIKNGKTGTICVC